MRYRFSSILSAALLAFVGAGHADAQHAEDIQIVASGPSGGQILAVADLDLPVLVQQGFCAAGLCLYSSTDPGFVSPQAAPTTTFAVAAGTPLSVQIVALDAGTSLKVGTAVLDAAGESASLGSAPSVHLHPSWQITAAAGAKVQRSLTFRIVPTGGPYTSSPEYSVLLSTYVESTTTSVTSSTLVTETTTTSTSTTTLEPGCGDGLVERGVEECDEGSDNGGRGHACSATCTWAECGDTDHSGTRTAGDALHVLRVAVGTATCHECLCDVRATAPKQFTATDALYLLRNAIGVDVTLECPACP